MAHAVVCHAAKGGDPTTDNYVVTAFTSKDHGADAKLDISPTLRSMGHDKSHSNGGGQVAIAFNATQDPISSEDCFGALSDPGAAVAFDERNITSKANRSRCEAGMPCHTLHAGAPSIAGPMSVRRLTPRECERLQGFPDDWTRWDADGKEISDSARYRMLGNAVTVTVAEWLGRQIVRVVNR